MPADHQRYLEWNGDRFRKWADLIGISTGKVVDSILTPAEWNTKPIAAVWDC